jgi:hypothetical protein
MKVEIGAEAALFPEKEYINGIAVAVKVLHAGSVTVVTLASLPWSVMQLKNPTNLKKKKLRHSTPQASVAPPFGPKKICEIQITPTIFRPMLGNNYCLQIIEIGFAEQFYASCRMLRRFVWKSQRE